MSNEMFIKPDSLDKTLKPIILKWLCSLFNYKEYPHSFRDSYIGWSIWDGELTISFDNRVEEQVKLISLIPPRFLGVPQSRTLKIVNEKTFYLELKRLLDIKYPNIIGSKLIKRNKERGGTGGWHSASDDFYSYNWEVMLDDNTSILHRNQNKTMDMVKGDYIYNCRIQERAFITFLNQFNYEKNNGIIS